MKIQAGGGYDSHAHHCRRDYGDPSKVKRLLENSMDISIRGVLSEVN